MMSWYRAAGMAFLLHLAVMVLFTFTFKGTRDMYKIDLIFWGSILRSQEVSSQERRLPQEPVDVKSIDASAGPRARLLLWSQAISIDKPDLFKNMVYTLSDDAFRFVGQRVDMDEQEPEPRYPENDMPPPAPVKMRLERP